MTQQDLAGAIGITFQQVQKYEAGSNRISSGRLFVFATILKVPISHFYAGLAEPAGIKERARVAGVRETQEDGFPVMDEHSNELAMTFETIGDPDVRKMMLKWARQLSAHSAQKLNKSD